MRPPSDIYAVGMTAYSLLTGESAFDLNSQAGISEMLKAIFEKPFVPIVQRTPDIPIRIAAVIEKAIAKEVENRWRMAGEMRESLSKAIG